MANKWKVLYLLNLPNVEHTCKRPLTHKTAHMNDDAMAKRAIAALG